MGPRDKRSEYGRPSPMSDKTVTGRVVLHGSKITTRERDGKVSDPALVLA